jgi:tRNA threonylcarbamoyladenosine biosynthesis protein TsaE
MVTLTSKSPEDTFRIAADFAKSAQPGLVLGLIGDLGAGKTQFVKGFAAGLGITERVHSPTFTLVNEYRSGRVRCYHLDLYRLDTPEQIHSAGLEQYFQPEGAVTLIEWFDRARGIVPTSERLIVVQISAPASAEDNERSIAYEDPCT